VSFKSYEFYVEINQKSFYWFSLFLKTYIQIGCSKMYMKIFLRRTGTLLKFKYLKNEVFNKTNIT